MEIKIRNFANIKSLDLKLEEGKLNFLYGISGSGKTSVSKALTTLDDDLQNFKTFGQQEDVVVTGNDREWKIFDKDSISEYIFTKSGEGVYQVLKADDKKSKAQKEKMRMILDSSDLEVINESYQQIDNKMKNIENLIASSYIGSGKLGTKGVGSKLKNPSNYSKQNDTLTSKEKLWITEGLEILENNKTKECPFCESDMSIEIIDKLKLIANELPEVFQKIVKNSEFLNQIGVEFNVSNILNETEQDKLYKSINKWGTIFNDTKKVLDIMKENHLSDSDVEKQVRFKISDETRDYYKEKEIDIDSIYFEYSDLKEGYAKEKSIYNKILMSNIRFNMKNINKGIQSFGIDYEFHRDVLLEDSKEYNLKHIDNHLDSSEALSTGEMNIIAMVLFLYSNESENVIIDDPASSFDEYRRDNILDYIMERRKGSNLKTTILLSHDQIFLKFLSRKIARGSNTVGIIGHFENINGEARIVPINKGDMDVLSTHIRKRLMESDTYTKQIINLRHYFEIGGRDSLYYKYLSFILHNHNSSTAKEEIADFMIDNNTDENKICSSISDIISEGFTLPIFEVGSFDMNEKGLTYFEKMALLREMLEGEEKIELDNVVHFNESLQHLLNPYIFNFQSKYAYQILEKNNMI